MEENHLLMGSDIYNISDNNAFMEIAYSMYLTSEKIQDL